jgi:hypothetical protein
LEHIQRQRAAAARLLREMREHSPRGARSDEALSREADMHALGRMLPHVMWYVWGVPGAAAARRALSRARSGHDLEAILADFLAQPQRYERDEAAPALR